MNSDKRVQLVCKAVDSSHNVQPENISGIWNVRGFLNNSWHRVDLEDANDAEVKDEDIKGHRQHT